MIQKRTLQTKIVNEFAATTAKVYLRTYMKENSSGVYFIEMAFSYYTDENDPNSEVILNLETPTYTVAEMNTEEDNLGPFVGEYLTDKINDMEVSITDEYLDTNAPYSTPSSGWENI